MRYYDIEVDFVACFIVKPNQNKFTYNIQPENIKVVTLDNGTKVPCTFLEDWYIVYKLLGRDKKASLIENVFRKKQIPFSEKALKASLNNEKNQMPRKLIKDITELIYSKLQPSLFDFHPENRDLSNEK